MPADNASTNPNINLNINPNNNINNINSNKTFLYITPALFLPSSRTWLILNSIKFKIANKQTSLYR